MIKFLVILCISLGGATYLLSMKVGSLGAKLAISESIAKQNKKLFDDEHQANQANRLIIYKLNKELTDVKTDLARSRTGTTVIGK